MTKGAQNADWNTTDVANLERYAGDINFLISKMKVCRGKKEALVVEDDDIQELKWKIAVLEEEMEGLKLQQLNLQLQMGRL